MLKNNRYAIYNKDNGSIIYIIDTPHGEPELGDNESSTIVNGNVKAITHKIDIITGIPYKASPDIDTVRVKAKENKAIKFALDELIRYEVIKATVVDQVEYDAYKLALNEAISNREVGKLKLPTRPSWFM